MATEKKCFVISPIGDEGSEDRKEADSLLWIIRTALEKYSFTVTRIDDIARASIITNEIVQLLQSADLCVIVLTGENPNVFYEAGRRHETGKPFIQLIRRGEKIPFDVAGIRAILYDDPSTLESATKLTAEIQKFVEELERTGYAPGGTGVSLSTLAMSLDRIEAKLSRMNSGAMPRVSGPDVGAVEGPLGLAAFKNPRSSFVEAVTSGDWNSAIIALNRIEQLLGPTSEFLSYATIVAQTGYEPAVDTVFRILTEHEALKDLDESVLYGAVSSLVHFYELTDRETEGCEKLEPFFDSLLADTTLEDTTRAFFMNQFQKLLYGAGKYERALNTMESVVALSPDEPAYIYNTSLITKKLGQEQRTIELVDRLVDMDSEDDDHLMQIVDVYASCGRHDAARSALEKLQALAPGKASLLMLKDSVKALLYEGA